MVITDFNLQDLRTRAFKGFVQFQDPDNSSIFLRLKERQTMSVTFNFSREPHYNDAGIKVLDPSGHNHTFTTVLKVTSDLLDDQYDKNDPDTGADQKTLSYWILKNELYEPIQIIFVVTLEARDGQFLHFKYTLEPQTFGPVTLGATGGTSNITVGGEVIAIEEIIKTSTADSP
jgi:hypothetical protein